MEPAGGAEAARRWAAAARMGAGPTERAGPAASEVLPPGAGGGGRVRARWAAREAARAGRVALQARQLSGSWAGAFGFADIQASWEPGGGGDRLLAAAAEEAFGGLHSLTGAARPSTRSNLEAALRLETRLAELREAAEAEEARAARAILEGGGLGAWGPPRPLAEPSEAPRAGGSL